MQITDGASYAIMVLAGIAQGADSHVGWRAELHWLVCTLFVLGDVAAEMRVWNGRNEQVCACSTVIILALVAALARMFKHACRHAAYLHERALDDNGGCSYVVFASLSLMFSSFANISVGHAAVLLASCFLNITCFLYILYLLREVLRPYEWRLYDAKRRFLRWIRRDDTRYTDDTVVEFRFMWVRPDSDEE